jgi:acylphosphatase
VQGVGFRWFAREEARSLDLAGWVRNDPDGSVEIAVSGAEAIVDRFVAAVERGPSGARVSRVVRSPFASEEPLPHPFAVRA